MTKTIAIAGKGGTGKTTFTAMVIKYLRERSNGYILAIDGDPSANLNLVLGMELEETIGHIREETMLEVKSGQYDASMSKHDYLEYRINQSLVEGDHVDLIAMGRPEGPGCYCAANNILRHVIDRLGNDYDYVVIDNEAGMEHISRQTTRDIDLLFIISDPTVRGLMGAKNIVDLTRELGTRIRRAYLVINGVRGELPAILAEQAQEIGVPLLGTLPYDEQVVEFDIVGRPMIQLDSDSILVSASRQLLDQVGIA
ncbi:MAG: AAA family ATPase [Anaerolineae bacterium]|jgi:CO dehydrogenase maturation factor|nr:AAA family ATPase [Anaerolineae bacterium]MDH7475573.1 AAA family ATPase [Anaerolineae bacterium]